MNKLKTVFSFEFLSIIKKRTIVITTLILCLISLAATFVPRIFSSSASDADDSAATATVPFDQSYGFVFDSEADQTLIVKAFQLEPAQILSSEGALKDAISQEKPTILYGFVVHSLTNYTYYVEDRSMYDSAPNIYESLMTSVITNSRLESNGIDPQVVQEATTVVMEGQSVVLGRDSGQGFIIAYVFMFVIYMLIILYGQNVSVSVAREKDSRTMELLITSTNPKTLIIGKVLAAGCAGIVQVMAIVLSVVIGFMINQSAYPEAILTMFSSTLSPLNLIIFALFSLSGYLLYLFIFAALGSLVSKVEDVSSSIAPVTYVFVIAFAVATFALYAPSASFVVISSYIPFVSIFTMPIRAMMVSVGWIEIIISLIIMIATTVVLAMLSVYIYRYGSLNYGNKLKLSTIFKSIKQKEH